MKLFNLALHSACLLTCSLGLTATAPVMAADTTTQETKTYQSSFDDYKPLSEDNLSDWKSINVPSNGGGHAGHSMVGIQHKMTPEQMANMPSDSKEMPAMEGMDHSGMEGMKKTDPDNMKGMDHSQMKPDQTMAPMAGMDHSKMEGMEHGNMKSMADNKPTISKEIHAMAGMDHSSMEGMKKTDPNNMKGMDHRQMKQDPEMPPMAGMDHSKMAGMKQDNMKSMPDNKLTISKEMPAMEGMDHSGMEGMKKMVSGNMKGMDHSQMKPDQTMAPMAGMDHSKIAGMEHGNMKSMTDSKSAVHPMKNGDMPEMNHDEMAGHDHGGSDMNAMDHSKISESKPNDMQPNQQGVAQEQIRQDESQPHEHASTQASEHAQMSMPSMATSTMQTTPWQIIPNLHPMIVHFPIALTLTAFLLSLAAYVLRSHPVSLQFAAAGHLTLWLAAIGAAAAVLFGWLAYNSVNHDDAGHAAMLLHRSWAVPTAIGLIFLASWDAWKYRVNELMSIPKLFVLFLLSQSIAVTGLLGGEVVYRHGIGVLSLPSSEISEHGHHHEHGGKDAAEHAHGMAEVKADENANERTELLDHEKGESHGH